MAVQRLNLTRDQLGTFLKNFEQIKQFEALFALADQVAPSPDTPGTEIIAGTGFSAANEALAQIVALAQESGVNSGVLEAKTQEAIDAVARINQTLELVALQPKQELGTISSQNADNVNITGGFISGLDAPLPVASGGTGQITLQTAMNSLAGAVTAGQYLRGNGTNVVMSTIQIVDLPTSVQSNQVLTWLSM
jgi:hypothetical protein